jgi:putative DNA primase/helicase
MARSWRATSKSWAKYGSTVRPETISNDTECSSQNPTEDIARLAGIRFANISSRAGTITQCSAGEKLTGTDTLNARFLHENSFDFSRSSKST